MSIQQFNQKGNIQMLWDLISEEEIFKFLTPNIQGNVYNIFLNNLQGFFEVEKKNNSLVDLNKKYILLILNHIKKNYPYQPSKITIHNEQPVKELITYEEIHSDRKSQFEKDLIRRQEEFEDSMNLKAPPVPVFADKDTDKPIKEIDKILKEMQSKRNYEVEQINRTYDSSNQVDNWLKPQETSLKNEKFVKPELTTEQTQNSRFTFLNSLQQDFSTNNQKKNVSFSDNNEIKLFSESEQQFMEDQEDNNIFSKLKRVNKEENITLQIYEPTIKEPNIKEPNIKEPNINEYRISKIERNMESLNEKMDKIIEILNRRN
jgi:hypothetical protein